VSQPTFCEQCGGPLNPGARFCGHCGHAVQPLPEAAAPQPPPPVQQAPQGEAILGVIPGAQRRKGLFGVQTFTLIVTDERLVLAEMTKQLMNQAVKEANAEVKRQGKGWLGQIAAQMGWMGRLAQRYQAMPVEAALRERPDNFFILNSHVRRASLNDDHDDDSGKTTVKLTIEANSGKHGFQLVGIQVGEARSILQQALGAAVR
jgi:hypothetical protein